ncbi:MAG: 3-deoxy-D-manno-octulosonate 8-phosphate phosphatase, YrbI family [Bacteroidetes bacterium]|jgi:3-deoxy-D-manno-octulosonate 8-phosphate phosphatase (KDO 8-P phosphatase)|nr:3-deoxy-D-manno-octulosonate 8-phosphate phosphatase, YrbI family [Bacteroidota bacterium]
MENFKTKLTRVNTFIFDMDGVLTNGTIWVMHGHDPIRNLNSKDGYAFQLAAKKGYKLFLLSGGNSVAVKEILLRSGFTEVYMAQHDKDACYQKMLTDHNLKQEEILYMGDDLPDHCVLKQVGVATCPADAAPEIKDICIYTSQKKGGEGCARDIVEQVMRARGDWEIANW